MLITAHNPTFAYLQALKSVEVAGRSEDSRLGPMKEVLGAQIFIEHAEAGWYDIPTRKFNHRYMALEALWNIADPTGDVALTSRVNSQVVPKYMDDQHVKQHARWAYGPGLYTGMLGAMARLERHKDTRRATMDVFREDYDIQFDNQGTIPCLTSVQYFIRDDKLHCVSTFRSQDAYMGLPYDLFALCLWQTAMAYAMHVEVGSLHHSPASLHTYESNRKGMEELITLNEGSWRDFGAYPNMKDLTELRSWFKDVNATLSREPDIELHKLPTNYWSWFQLIAVACGRYSDAPTEVRAMIENHDGIGWKVGADPEWQEKMARKTGDNDIPF